MPIFVDFIVKLMPIEVQYLTRNCIDRINNNESKGYLNFDLYSIHEHWEHSATRNNIVGVWCDYFFAYISFFLWRCLHSIIFRHFLLLNGICIWYSNKVIYVMAVLFALGHFLKAGISLSCWWFTTNIVNTFSTSV